MPDMHTQSVQQSLSANSTIDNSYYEPSGLVLDELYKDKLICLRDIIFKVASADDVKLCDKWVKIFSMTTTDEKMARNCLCELMQRQLTENGCLSLPFTDPQNCNRNLEQVFRMLDDDSLEHNEDSKNSETDYMEQNMSNMINTFVSHQRSPIHYLPVIEQNNENDAVLMECVENNLKAENVQLRQDLESMRLQYTEKQIENLKLVELVNKLQHDNIRYARLFSFVKAMMLNSVNAALRNFENDMPHDKMKIFETVFASFADDKAFIASMKMADVNLKMLINQKFGGELVRRKKNFAHHVSLQMIKTKCFKMLRDICIKAQTTNDHYVNVLEVLKELDEQCRHMMKEVG